MSNIQSLLAEWTKSITQAFSPRIHCLICHVKTPQVVCEACLQHLTTLGHKCTTCARPLSIPTDTICGHCIKHKPALDGILTVYAYTAPLRFLIHEFKYREGYFLTKTLTKMLLDALPKDYMTDCIVPVPMHTQRLRERGFDHTLWLARAVSRHVPFHLETNLCKKTNHTTNSAQLNAEQRKKNTQDAYQVQPSRYQHVTLLDDLTTTGETANTLARLLKKNGAQTVMLWCCARALMDRTSLPK